MSRTFNDHDGRFTIERHKRRPRRGPADTVTDGWTITDTITRTARGAATIADANRYTDHIIADEQALIEHNIQRAWITTPTGKAPIGILEAWGTTPTGQRFKLGVFPTTDTEQRIAALCDHLNIP